MGRVGSGRDKERCRSCVGAGRKGGATPVLDGRSTRVEKHPRGHFVGPTVFDGVQPDMTIGKEEIFGPVASVTHVSNLEEGIDVVQRRSEEHTSELQSHLNLVCRLLLEKKKIDCI